MIVTRSSQYFGIALLVFVNIVWVAASEITRYLFIDLDFKRPFFFTYAKSCMLSLFLLRYACACSQNPKKKCPSKNSGKSLYRRLNEFDDDGSGNGEESDEEMDFDTTLTEAEFELIAPTDIESNTGGEQSTQEGSQNSLTEINPQAALHPQHQKGKRRRVRFNKFREVRSWPEKLQDAAKLARLPYRPKSGDFCRGCPNLAAQKHALFNYSFYFAPLWLVGSVTYQTALAYSSVSSVNLISASSPLFVLLFGAFFGRYSTLDNFNWFKLIMVLMNFGGVCIVSKFSDSVIGSVISLFSAFSNALYLFALSRLSVREEHIDMPLMLGIVGIFSLLVCTPMMLVLHGTGLEPQLPLPTLHQLVVLVTNSFLGTLFADSLWLYATLLTGSLTSALSGSLAIPLSMLADSFFRNQPPNIWQLLSSIPIMISFIGASYHTAIQTPQIHHLPLNNDVNMNDGNDDECTTEIAAMDSANQTNQALCSNSTTHLTHAIALQQLSSSHSQSSQVSM